LSNFVYGLKRNCFVHRNEWIWMVTEAQARILRLLAEFPVSLEKAWDVPRDLSLPGIAEKLGLVRSALNPPINNLQSDGYILIRMAHVIGTGSRRRNVHHITEAGRELVSGFGHDFGSVEKKKSKKKTGVLHGDAPKLTMIHGRQKDLENSIQTLDEKSNLILRGIAGIGKTALSGHISNHYVENNHSVHWASATMFTDIHSMIKSWNLFENTIIPKDVDNILESIKSMKKMLLVLDDVEQIHSRHMSEIKKFCEQITSFGQKVLICGRVPLPFEDGFEILNVDTLDETSSAKMLGEHDAGGNLNSVIQMLGGHPLALKLYIEDAGVQESNLTIHEFVQEVLLSGLSQESFDCLDELTIMPTKISVSELINVDQIGELDEYGLLRWDENSERCELHHLIRNTRREMLSDERLEKILLESADWWSSKNTSEGTLLSLHFSVELGEIDRLEFIQDQVTELVIDQNAGLSVVVDNALKLDELNPTLNRLAATVSLERGELIRASKHIDKLGEMESSDLRHRLSVLKGDKLESEKSLLEQISNSSPKRKAQLCISAASNILDDRLSLESSSKISAKVSNYIEDIEYDKLEPDVRQSCLLSVNLIKHTAALLANDFVKAEEYRKSLKMVTNENDIIIRRLSLRSSIAQMDLSQREAIISEVDNYASLDQSTLQTISLELSLAEKLYNLEDDNTESYFNKIDFKKLQLLTSSSAQRLKARWWVLKSKFSDNPGLAIREAISLYRKGGCLNASNKLGKQLHSMLQN